MARIIAMKSCLAVVAMFAMLVQSVRADKWAGKQLVVLQREKGVALFDCMQRDDDDDVFAAQTLPLTLLVTLGRTC